MRRNAFAALAAGLWLFAPPSLEAQLAWKTLDWNVFCGPPLVAVVSQALCDRAHSAAIQLGRDQLEATSRYLQGLGFGGPALSAFRDPGTEEAAQRGTQEWKNAPSVNRARELVYLKADAAGDDPRCVNAYCARLVPSKDDHGEYDATRKVLRINPEFWWGFMPGPDGF